MILQSNFIYSLWAYLVGSIPTGYLLTKWYSGQLLWLIATMVLLAIYLYKVLAIYGVDDE
jgi:uncharacterized membrane protein YoaK (UPF0700 family)